jgi:uncharacterized protein involved in outer membrane biogenesis
MLKKLLIALTLVVILLVAALTIIPSFVPDSAYKTRLEAELSRALLRDVTLDDGIEIATFPVIRAKTQGVRVANADGFDGENFINIDSLEARIRLWPLLSKRVEVAAFTLTNPKIILERRADGATNWTVGDPTKPKPDAGPFKRDGRYTDYDPALDRLTIVDGQVTYRDAVKDVSVNLGALNATMSLPGLEAPLKLDGTATWDGMAVALDGTMNSPKAFLSGLATPFDVDVKTDAATVALDGAFRPGADIALDAQTRVKVSDLRTLASRVPLPDGLILPPLNNLNLEGALSLEGGAFEMRGLRLVLDGDDLSGIFNGDVAYADALKATGDFSADIGDMGVLAPYVKDPVQAERLKLAQSVKASGQISMEGTTTRLTNLDGTVNGPQLSAGFQGSAEIIDSAASVSGPFTFSTDNVAELAKAAGLDQAEAAAIGAVSANGTLAMKDGVIRVTGLDASARDGAVNGTFAGDLALEDTPRLTGRYSFNVPNMTQLDAILPADVPYAEALGRVAGQGEVGFQSGLTTLTGTSLTLSDGTMNGDFTGNVRLADGAPTLDGRMDLNFTSLRELAAIGGTDLPPSTDAGPIFSTARIAGAVTGQPEALSFTGAEFAMDALEGSGDFELTTGAVRPKLTGTVALEGMDVRPYMAAWSAQRPQGEIVPWSETPINTAALQALDADIAVTTPNLIMDRVRLNSARLDTSLRDGVLTAKVPTVSLYGGKGTASLTLDTTQAIPTVAIEADLSLMEGQNFLSAIAGFTQVDGEAGTKLTLRGQGASQAAIMKSLGGSGLLGLKDGSIQGIDAATFLTGLDQALTSKSLPSGLGRDQITRFRDMVGAFSMENGVAKVDNLTFSAGNVVLEGGGQIDIGGQALDFSLRPRLANASGLANFGIPLRFQGPFGGAKAGLDTPFLTQIIEAKARQKAGDLVRDELGGALGDVVGGIIGTGGTSSTTTPETEGAETAPVKVEDAATQILDSLIKKPETTTPEESAEPAPETEAPPKTEPTVEDALKDLFRRKKSE